MVKVRDKETERDPNPPVENFWCEWLAGHVEKVGDLGEGCGVGLVLDT